MNTLRFLAFVALSGISMMSQASDVTITHYETLQAISVAKSTPNTTGVSQKIGDADVLGLSFEALGQRFDLRLQPNQRVLSAVPEDALAAGVVAYRGTLVDHPDSWARIVMFAGEPRGLIWDGETMYAVEAPGDSAIDASSTIVYRLDDLYVPPGTMSCGVQSLPGNGAEAFAKVQRELTGIVAEAPGAVSEITMSVIGDYEFTSAKGGNAAAAAAITARFNNIDGYFSEQVGIQLSVDYIETFESPSDPFGDTTEPAMLLDELSEYRLQTPAHRSRGLTHLYTGRSFPTSTVGIAWRGALCTDYFSAGLSEGNAGITTDSLIAAHEIGHNFGAQHDGEPGSSCENEPEIYIMAPAVTGNDQFSACSIQVMQAEAAGASCVTPLPTIDVGIRQVSQVSTVLLGASTDVEFEVFSSGTLAASDVVADFAIPTTLAIDSVTTTMGNCSSGAGTVSCTLGEVPGLSSQGITISTTPVGVGVGMFDANVSTSDTDEQSANNAESIQVTVDPAVDLVVNAPSTAPVFVDNTTTVTATLENRTSLAATNVDLSISLGAGLRADSATWSIGTCSASAQQVDCQASSFGGQSSSTLTITATALADGAQDVTMVLSSPQADSNPGNNSGSATVNVVTPNADDDGDSGGGGTTGPLFLLVLLLTVVLMWRLDSPRMAQLPNSD